MLLTAIITYLITCKFFCKKPIDIGGGTRTPTTICMDYDSIAPPTLTTNMVKSMVFQYKDAQLNNIQTAATNAVPKDARAIWFDLETLKQFLYQIEQKTAQHPTEIANKKLGVRIYYAAYPEKQIMSNLAQHQTDPNFSYNEEYEKLHTLVMIPTITGAGNENYDFNPLDVTTYDGFTNVKKENSTFSFDSDTYTTLSLGTSRVNSQIGVNSAAQVQIARNHGSLYPPTGSSSCLGF